MIGYNLLDQQLKKKLYHNKIDRKKSVNKESFIPQSEVDF